MTKEQVIENEECSKGGLHEWGTDGVHFNTFCKKCFKNKDEGREVIIEKWIEEA